MRTLVIGATGTIGAAVSALLEEHGHDVVGASRSGSPRVDLTDPASVTALFAEVGRVDAVAVAAGSVPYAPLADLTRSDVSAGIEGKLLSQIGVVLSGTGSLNDGGSFTLITGVLAQDPIRTGAVASTVNGALESFVSAAAVELPRGIRINAVSPTVLTESLDTYGSFFPGFRSVPAREVAAAYLRSIAGADTGRVYRV
jgi:NAD(P)-dependent dehydrogenase (short-subunit alcohol dehydrogenase family)